MDETDDDVDSEDDVEELPRVGEVDEIVDEALDEGNDDDIVVDSAADE